jgi:HK97 family phage major capsid protein
LLENNDATGGYLVPTELHAGIFRIAASVGIVARDAQFFPMSTDTLDVPRYTGADLLGSYVGEDTEGTETSVSFGDARLKVETWQVIFRVGNTLLSDASVNVADWLLALAAEGLAARLDKEGFVGGTYAGSPFVGILGSTEVTEFTCASGHDTFAEFTADDASDAIGNIRESILVDCAFYFHRTVWAKIRQAKTANGSYTVGQNNSMIAANFKKYGIQPAGVMWDYPVYTVESLPANSATAVSTRFGVFGNLKYGLFVGDRGPVEVAKSDSATVGGKNVFAANQTAIRIQHRHAISIGLPSALVVIKTAAS